MAGAPSTDMVQVRVHIEMRNRTANAKIRVAAQSSDDGIGWNDTQVVLVTGWTQANGITYGTAWINIQTAYTNASATLRAFLRIGVECGGTTAGQNELCVVAVRVDVKSS